MTIKTTAAVAAAMIAVCGAAEAGGPGGRVALSGDIGTLGGKVEAHLHVNRYLSVRGGYNYLEFEGEFDFDDLTYSPELDMSGAIAAVDLHPFRNGFVVSAGAHFGAKSANLEAIPTEAVEIGGDIYTPAQIGTITGDLDLGETAPYLGFGYNGAFSNSRLGMVFMVGALLIDEPTVSLTADGLLASDPDFIADLQQEAADLEEDASDYPFYPVVSLGLTLRF